MASDMPARYIDREGISEQETAEKVRVDEIEKYRRENLDLKEDLSRLREQHDEVMMTVEGLKDNFKKILKDDDIVLKKEFLESVKD
jgi:hypothetical protein